MELTSHLWIGSAFDSYRSNEMKLAHRMTRAKQRGDVNGEVASSGQWARLVVLHPLSLKL
jgi:hypothetical protein